MVSLEELEKTTDAIIKARRALAEAKEQVITCKKALIDRDCKQILQGLDGKNQAERDAQLRILDASERAALDEAEKRERAAILALEICKDLRRHLENIISVELCKEEA